MKKYYPYLEDKEFLKEFDLLPLKTQFVKLTVLDWKERPIRELQGRVTNGSVSLNGDSSIRRTCNLSLVADETENDFTNINSLISIGKKINVEIGFLNTMNKYKDFKKIWFPMGLFIVAGLSLQHNTTSFSMSLTLKDKMCLLNGEFGGVIPASARFDAVDEIDAAGKITTKKLHLIEIIQYALTEFGGEQLDNIIINDLEPYVKTIKKWVGDTDLYIQKDGESITLTTQDPTAQDEGNSTNIDQIESYTYGQDIGYMYDIFYYSNELTFDAGTFVTSVLDKIKSYLGNFEYYYDVYGRFIFQEIKNYKNKTYVTELLNRLNNDAYFADFGHAQSVYTFDNKIANSFSANPQYSMIKNDYIVWGQKESIATGNKLPIRYHLAIDKKPVNTNNISFYCKFNTDGSLLDIVTSDTEGYTAITPVDWRTLLLFKGFLSQKDKDNYYDEQANYYFLELNAEWHKIYDIQQGAFRKATTDSVKPIIEEDPSGVSYYLDFIDNADLVDSIGISVIGKRSKVVKKNEINCLFEIETPNYLFINSSDKDKEKTKEWCISRDEAFIQLDSTYLAQIATSAGRNAAFTTIQAMLNENTKYNESISFNSLPIYYIEPNSRITVRDIDSQIYGDYMIKTMSIPLGISGTMSVSCSKIIDRT